MTLKLRLVAGKLSVTLEVANPTTLTAIQEDRDLIASRLASPDQSLADLVIQRQAPSNTETFAANATANDSDGSSSRDGEASPGEASSGRPGASPRRAARDGRAFSDLVV